ncbi:MAG TPA: patatin-like phospholipase family protein [Candidatus Nitrosocosmicus sp.]|nr:patatin-like phospholipase family protein [Candidatus Nitrosocosmicus sp.]
MSGEKKEIIENVLILQGGGSLGAFGCGVYKALTKHDVDLDLIAGTSIGGVNAAIIAGSRNRDTTAQILEEFWIELSESFVELEKSFSFSNQMNQFYENVVYPYYKNDTIASYLEMKKGQRIKIKQLESFYSSANFGNEKFFKPRWFPEYAVSDPEYFTPMKWTYLYDHKPLIKTLDRYIDYSKLRPGNSNPRLILTAVSILDSKALIFDSFIQQIQPKHILATSAYPLYNFPWIEVDKGVFAWDGGLLSNTPLREVLDSSPVKDKKIFLVENYPKEVELLPANLAEVYHRARDIIFSDKTEHNIKMSGVITRYLDFIEELYQIFEDNADKLQLDKNLSDKIRRKYKKYHGDHGAEIKEIYYFSRDEKYPHIFENADFSPDTIKELIRAGEDKANKVIQDHRQKKMLEEQ